MNFQSDYCDEDGNPIVFYVGRLPKNPYAGRSNGTVFIWASNEFFDERFLLFGIDDEEGIIFNKARSLAQSLNEKAKELMVPEDFDDWVEELTEDEKIQVMSSSKKA